MNPRFKIKYRVTNWREYEAGLRARGDVQIWFSEEALAQWMAEPTGQPGAQRRYSDTAISTVLSLSLVFHLPLRQAEGFATSLLRLTGIDLDVPTTPRSHGVERMFRSQSLGLGPADHCI